MPTLKSYGELPKSRFVVLVIFILFPIFLLFISVSLTLFLFAINMNEAKKVTISQDYISFEKEVTDVFANYAQQTNQNFQSISKLVLEAINILKQSSNDDKNNISKPPRFDNLTKSAQKLQADSKKSFLILNQQINRLNQKVDPSVNKFKCS